MNGRLLALFVAFVLAVAPRAGAQTPADVGAIVDRMAAWVEQFQHRFGSMVTEERYEQTSREPIAINPRIARAAGDDRVTLVSDFLLVQVPGEGWTPFRDVFERNGTKLRDREDRLAKLFLNGSSRSAFDQAREIMFESARYNIGTVERTINVPTLPLVFLTPAHRGRFRFTLGKRDPERGAEVEFREVGAPTYIATTGGKDMPSAGRFWVDEETGAVRGTELEASDTAVAAQIKVTYRFDDSLQLWVPARMEERYRNRRSGSDVRGVATYSRFRKFQVSTSEELAP